MLVVEEKSAFVESAIRDVLYGLADAPAVIGSADAEGAPLVPVAGELTAGALAGPLRRVLAGRVELAEPRREPAPLPLLAVGRTPYFCSGCPHNRSTLVPEGAVAGGGIGCHAMVALTGRPESLVTSITQMGGEGAQWIGQAPYTEARHMFQNMGDGTFAHSGQLAVQACVAAGVSITYKLLFNRAVAMTGGQDAAGGLEVPELAAKLLAEGVARIIVCADEPERFRALSPLPAGVDLWHRDRRTEAESALAATPGVTVLVYDQRCAAESRRLRKRGAIPVRTTRVVINEAVCEGCGDCGVKSNCLSVQPVETELGRKTHIDQTSCNTDYSCLAGDCPSFVTVEVDPSAATARRERPEPPAVPDVAHPDSGDVFLAGIGGTGIVTVNQVLGSAAVRDGRAVHGVDQTGLSQKAGPVTSHLRIARDAAALGPANRVGTAGCYLAFDALVGADARNLGYADAATTVAVVSTSPVPTGAMVRDPSVAAADIPTVVERIAGRSRELVRVDAQAAANALFGDAMPANLLLVGAAYQSGALPLSAAAIEWAIELNGVAVAVNTAAFRWGRVAVADPAAFAAATAGAPVPTPPVWTDLGGLAGETRRLVGIRAALLADYQDAAHRPPLRRRRAHGVAGRARAGCRYSVLGGRRPRPVQAHRVQGRVRGGPAAHRPRVRGAAGRGGARRQRAALPPAPADAQGARQAEQDRPRPVDAARPADVGPREGVAWHPARPVRPRPDAPAGAGVARRVPGDGAPAGGRAVGADPRPGRRRRRGRRSGARVRGRQARGRAPLPGEAGRAGFVPSVARRLLKRG